ncbi:MAG: threonine--tRNA ligase [Thermoprotei archaeon]
MKVLQLHADYIEYQPVKKEINLAEESDKSKVRYEEIVVLLTTVEAGDDEKVVDAAVADVGKSLVRLGVNKILIYPYAHLSQSLAPPEQALSVLRSFEKAARDAGLVVNRAPFGWTKSLAISVKGHPLAEQSKAYGSGSIAVSGASGRKVQRAYTEKEMLARIRKSDFVGLPEYDHRVLGERLDLFSFHEPSPGMVFWHDKGLKLKHILFDFIRRQLSKHGYIEISTPPLANTVLWRVSGHWEHYKDNMFITELGGEEFGLKPMNCPSTFLFYKSRRWSYRDLPLKVADFDPLFRNELSGVASGLFRVRVFEQDDGHIFAAERDVEPVLSEMLEMLKEMYSVFGLNYSLKISTMPDDHIGTVEQWNEAQATLFRVCEGLGLRPSVKEKEGAFYGPKIDVDVKDSLGREWQLATIQLDYQMPKRFELTYEGADGKEHTPVVIHRVIYGSLERFIGILLEHFKGNLPVWLCPVQAKVITVSESSKGYGLDVLTKLRAAGLRAEGDFDDATVGSKVKAAQILKIPYMIVVGEAESKSQTVSVRTRDGTKRQGLTVEQLIEEIGGAIRNYR